MNTIRSDQVKISNYCDNVICFATAAAARARLTTKRRYTVRPAPPSREWMYECSRLGFLEITRLSDGAKAYARLDDEWRHDDAWARARFNDWEAKCRYWHAQSMSARADALIDLITEESLDVLLSPACRTVFGAFGCDVRDILDRLPIEWEDDEQDAANG